jgi:hypothetical protein
VAEGLLLLLWGAEERRKRAVNDPSQPPGEPRGLRPEGRTGARVALLRRSAGLLRDAEDLPRVLDASRLVLL